MDELGSALARLVGAAHVRTEPDLVAGHTVDWTGRFLGRTPAVVRPGSAEEVAAVVAWCADRGVAVVAQGGNTGLVGGSVPLAGEVVLHLGRLDAIGAVDRLAGQVTAGGGATLEAVQRAAGGAGFEVAVDLAARSAATIGGMVATNAGGSRVLRHGPMRAQVVGIEAVLGDGSVVSHLGGLAKDNTGYDLAGLLCGSEGTLGVVTAVRLRLVPALAERAVALLAVPGVAAALEALAGLRRAGVPLEAAELMLADGVRLVCTRLGLVPPFAGEPAAYLLVEAAAHSDPLPALAAAVEPLQAAGAVTETAVAVDASRRAELWRYREAHTEAINAAGVPHKLDVTLPLDRLPAFCERVPATVAEVAPGARTVLFGHVGDGNLHVNVVGAAAAAAHAGAVPDAVDGAVLGLVAELGGSISAEHGIGTAKKAWLHLNRSPAEIAAFRRLKAALDPAGILNPNVLLP